MRTTVRALTFVVLVSMSVGCTDVRPLDELAQQLATALDPQVRAAADAASDPMDVPHQHVEAALRDHTGSPTEVGHVTVHDVSQLEGGDTSGRQWTTTALVSIVPIEGEPFCAILAWNSDGENTGAAAEGDPLEASGCGWVLQRPQQGLLEQYSG